MSYQKKERIIALAGLFQAAGMVHELARVKSVDQPGFTALIESLFVMEPENTLAVYSGDPANLQAGLTWLNRLAGRQADKQAGEVARYVLSLLAVERQLAKKPDMQQVIHSRLKHLSYKREHFSNDPDDIISNLSAIYQDTLSTLKFRIQVTGNMQHLSQKIISDKVRALLFAGVRSAMLWRQLGGSKWQLVFGRTDMQKYSDQLLQDISRNQQ